MTDKIGESLVERQLEIPVVQRNTELTAPILDMKIRKLGQCRTYPSRDKAQNYQFFKLFQQRQRRLADDDWLRSFGVVRNQPI